jgi:hypothetical protein
MFEKVSEGSECFINNSNVLNRKNEVIYTLKPKTKPE